MDFVEGLGDTSNTLEIAVDDIGRVEIHHDRARVTLITYRTKLIHPALCLVWGVSAWKAARRHHEMMHDLICGRVADPDIITKIDAGPYH